MILTEEEHNSVQHEVSSASASHEQAQQSLTLESVLRCGNFDGFFIIFDYMTFEDESFVKLMRGVGDVLSRVEKDERIRELTAQVGYSDHFMVSLRKREIALEVLLPLIEKIGTLSFPEYPDENDPDNDQRRRINLVYTAMYLATGYGTKAWPVDAFDLFPMEGKQRAALIGRLFEKDKLADTTLFERQTRNFTFGTFQANGGEMSETQYEAARDYQPTAFEIAEAKSFIANAMIELSRGREEVSEELGVAAAKIRHTSPEKASVPNILLAESMIFIGRP